MEYREINDRADAYSKRYLVSLDKDEASELASEIYAFFALQSGIECVAKAASPVEEIVSDHDLNAKISNCMANQCADRIIEKEGIQAALEPVVEDGCRVAVDREFECEITIFVKPEAELSSYDPIVLDIPQFCVSEEQMKRNIDAFIEDNSDYVDDTEAQEVDEDTREVISLHTDKLGMEVQPLTFDNVVYRIGDGRLPKEIEEQLMGMSLGQTKKFDFKVTSKNFLGMEVEETMTAVLSVNRFVKKEVPEITDEWVKSHVPGAHDVAGLYSMIRDNVTARARIDYDKLADEAASRALAERLPELDVPETYYEYVKAGLLQNVATALSRQGMSEDEFILAQGTTKSLFMIQMNARSKEVFRQGLALDSLAKNKGLRVDESDLDAAAQTISPKKSAEVKRMLRMNGRLYQLREMALRMKARSYLRTSFVVKSA